MLLTVLTALRYVSKSTGCLLDCVNGIAYEGTSCNKISIQSVNNDGKLGVTSALNRLPSWIFDRNPVKLNLFWEKQVEFPIIQQASGFVIGLAGERVINLGSESWYVAQSIIHEYMHAWAYEHSPHIPPNAPFAALGDAISLLWDHTLGNGAYVPQDYLKVVGCSHNVFSGYTYVHNPVVTYKGHSTQKKDQNKIDCGEDFAESAAWYVTNACELQSQSPQRYEYFKKSVFSDPKTGKAVEYTKGQWCDGRE